VFGPGGRSPILRCDHPALVEPERKADYSFTAWCYVPRDLGCFSASIADTLSPLQTILPFPETSCHLYFQMAVNVHLS